MFYFFKMCLRQNNEFSFPPPKKLTIFLFDPLQILSETNVMRVSFYIAEKAVGATGFRAVWTEVRRRDSCGDREFKCRGTR